MKINLKSNLTILNIFGNDVEFIDQFVRHHCPMVKTVIMMNTGYKDAYEYAKSLKATYNNLEVFYEEYDNINFSAFRNNCFRYFNKDTPYYCWIDTDELLNTTTDDINLSDDIVNLTRIDGSLRFTTSLNRIFNTSLDGVWYKSIHEHYCPATECTYGCCDELSIQHLTSEAARSPEKKLLYFKILQNELNVSVSNESRQDIINALQHLIIMASHDFKNPELCVEYFSKFRDLIYSINSPGEISSIQKLNILLHAVISYSRLHLEIDTILIDNILKIDSSKSTMFQLLRGMSFNPNNIPYIKDVYENQYNILSDELAPEFDNLDFLNKKEVEWFKNKIYAL